MEVNASKNGSVAEHIAAAAKAKKAAQGGESSAASLFASAVSAATAGAASAGGLGALGGMFSNNDDNGDVGQDDYSGSNADAYRERGEDKAPVERHAESNTQDYDDRPRHNDAPVEVPVASASQPTAEPVDDAPVDTSTQHTDAAPTDDTGHQGKDEGNGKETAAAPQTQTTAKADGATVAQAQGNMASVVATAGAEQTAATTNTAKAAVTDPSVVKEAAAVAGQTQTADAGTGEGSTKKQNAPAQTAQQAAVVKGASTDDAAPQQDAAKLKTAAKPAQTQSQAQNTHQSATQAKAGVESDAGSQQTQTQAQAQAQDLNRRLGGNQRVDVAVTVEKEADTLTSRPTVSLAATATKSASLRGGEAGQNGQNSAGNNQSQAQAQAQAALQNQAAAGQAASRAAAGGFQAQVNAATGAQAATASGGAEGINAATATAGTTPGATTQQANAAAPQSAPKQAHSPQTARAVAEQVSVQIAKAAGNGMDKISIRLNPASMGRIDVQLELGQDGRMTATIMADNKDTLDMLKSDARSLVKALQDAGMDTSSGDLNFSMRGDNPADQDAQGGSTGRKVAEPQLDMIEQPLEALLSGQANRNVITQDRVDIKV